MFLYDLSLRYCCVVGIDDPKYGGDLWSGFDGTTDEDIPLPNMSPARLAGYDRSIWRFPTLKFEVIYEEYSVGWLIDDCGRTGASCSVPLHACRYTENIIIYFGIINMKRCSSSVICEKWNISIVKSKIAIVWKMLIYDVLSFIFFWEFFWGFSCLLRPWTWPYSTMTLKTFYTFACHITFGFT